MRSVLVIDDESGIRSAVKDVLEDERYRVRVAEDGLLGLKAMEEEAADLVVLDVWLPRMGGMDVLRELREKYPETEVIVISGHANIDMAVQATKLGAFDFIEKPLSLDRLITVARNANALSRLKAENRKLKREILEDDVVVAESPSMLEVMGVIRQSAASEARILITGENGTGKELAARAIHRQSARSEGPFVELNCAAIPDTLLESELFGHEKGAFTDAGARRRGKFEQADGGTLFLDEIADMSLTAQAKVLRAIQDMRIERLGGEESIAVDVRVIAATNKDLSEEIRHGRFREDLYFRLNVIPIRLPPLRERGGDVAALARHFLSQYSRGRSGRDFSPEAIDLLASQSWPGNIRELKNLVERISVMCDEDLIGAERVAAFITKRAAQAEAPASVQGLGREDEAGYDGMHLGEAKELFERNFICRKLREQGYNITRTAEALGIYPSNLHAKLRKYGIQVGK